jgi:outer membrane protein assembly factor BamB
VQRWSIEDRKILERKTLGVGKDCVAAELSPQGDLYVCVGSQFNLQVFRVSSGEQIFAAQVGDAPGSGMRALLPLHLGLPHSEPFGYFLSGTVPPPVEQEAVASNIQFSPDGRYLVTLGPSHTPIAFDLQERKKIGLPGSIKHASEHKPVEFLTSDRVLFVAPEKADESAILSFPGGQTQEKLSIAGSAWATSDPRYLIYLERGKKEGAVLDIQTGKSVAKASKDGGDVLAGEVVSYSSDAGLEISQLGKDLPDTRAYIEPGPLPLLKTAIASPQLDALAVSVNGEGGIFNVATGAEISAFPGSRGAWFANDRECYLRVSEAPGLQTSTVENLNLATSVAATSWPREDIFVKDESLFSGPVMLAEVVHAFYFKVDATRVGYELRALDLNTGKVLWDRDYGGHPPREGYEDEPPVTFTDPQGERVVLGWSATSPEAGFAVKHDATAKLAMKNAKFSAHDSVFEVLDARTGSTLGAAFVPGGSGPQGYSSAFSAGDWLILVKDGVRITAISLSTGTETLRATALIPALSPESGLLGATEDGGRLLLYDLKTGTRRDNYTFPENVVYMRFSSDGKRLLALTEYQRVYILDLADALAAPPTPQ